MTSGRVRLLGVNGVELERRILERLAQCIPGSHLAIMPAVTHFMSYQAPDAFNRIVLEFLARR